METKKDNKVNTKAFKPKKVKVKITGPVAGKYLFPYKIGQEVSLPENQAKELIADKVAEKA